jgi:hypothetical protein
MQGAQDPVPPPNPAGPGQPPTIEVIPVSANVQVVLNGATDGARAEFSEAVQTYAMRLASESEKQEISNRPPGVMFPEVTASSVVRARTVLSRYGERARPGVSEVAALVGLPIFSSAAGVIGSYLHSVWQWAAFSGSAFLGVFCVCYLAFRRLL